MIACTSGKERFTLNAETLQLGCFTEIYNKSTREYEWRSEGVSREDLTAWSRTG